MAESPLIAMATLAALCGACQWLAWRLKLPSIVFLLLAGILVGPILHLFNSDEFFGHLLFPFVSVAVAIILFEGGLTLKLSDIRGHGAIVTRLITVGVLITWILLAVAVHWIFQLPWPLAFVFGSITVVSGPTVIKPLLRTVRPSDKIGHLLHWEGILIDPIGVFLALLVFEYVLLEQPGNAAPQLLLILTKLIVIGGSIGVASGYATAFALRRYLVPDFLKNVLTLIVVIVIFAIAESLQHESGLLAVTIMGIWLANARGLHVDEILHFKENLSVLLISTLFIVLAARLDLALIPSYGWQIVLLLIVAQFLIRPVNAWLCTIGSELSTAERLFLGWIAPRGIVAAAVSSLFALRLQASDIPGTELLVPLVFSLIIGTVLFQSFTAKPLANKLGLSNPEPNGVLLFGAGDIGLALAKALRQESIKVLLTDTSWRSVRLARQAGFEAYHGNPTSGHAEENLDLQGIGKLIAVSSNRDTNALATLHYRSEFGSESVFTLEGASDDDAYERFDTANRNRANPLFDASLSYSRLQKRLRSDVIRHITVKDQESNDKSMEGDKSPSEANNLKLPVADGAPTIIDNDTVVESNEQQSIKDTDLRLFAIDKDGKLYIHGSNQPFTPKPGWRLIVLSEQDPATADAEVS